MQGQILANIFAFFLLAGCYTTNCNASDGYEALYRAISPYGFGHFYNYDYPFGYADQFRNERRRDRGYRYHVKNQKKYWYNFGNERLQVYRPDHRYRHMHSRRNMGGQRYSPTFRNRYSPGNLLNGRFSDRRGQ